MGCQLFLFRPDFPMLNEDNLRYLGYKKRFMAFEISNVEYVLCEIFAALVSGEEIPMAI